MHKENNVRIFISKINTTPKESNKRAVQAFYFFFVSFNEWNLYSDDSFLKQTLALHYYIKCHISLGYCAEIAGMTKEDFMKFLGKNGISIFNYENKDELMEELSNA